MDNKPRGEKAKKGFFARLAEKIDEKLKEKAKSSSCCCNKEGQEGKSCCS